MAASTLDPPSRRTLWPSAVQRSWSENNSPCWKTCKQLPWREIMWQGFDVQILDTIAYQTFTQVNLQDQSNWHWNGKDGRQRVDGYWCASPGAVLISLLIGWTLVKQICAIRCQLFQMERICGSSKWGKSNFKLSWNLLGFQGKFELTLNKTPYLLVLYLCVWTLPPNSSPWFLVKSQVKSLGDEPSASWFELPKLL